jgi:geranylgeranyl diphosphate synthase type I
MAPLIHIFPKTDMPAIEMQDATDTLKSLGEPIVKEAFDDLFARRIASPMAKRVLRRFSHRWTDYTRAALMVMACRSVGGDGKSVRSAAKGLVLAGGAFDLHDDIIDRSFIRTEKGKKSIQGMYGVEAALLAGDALMIEGLIQLSHMPGVPEKVARRAVTVIQDGLFELGSAEMEELRYVRNLGVTPRSYLRIVRMKGADVESYTRVGAILGGGSAEEVDALGSFGRYLGMICIIRDDIVDTFNDLVECRSRLTRESLPLPVLYSLKDERVGTMLRGFWSKPEKEEISNEELAELIDIIHENQGFEKGQALINRYINTAKNALGPLKNPEPFKQLFYR